MDTDQQRRKDGTEQIESIVGRGISMNDKEDLTWLFVAPGKPDITGLKRPVY
jgi:hypothetical protein